MTIALIGNALLGFAGLTVMLILLAGAIVRSRADERRLATAARRTFRRRRVTSAPRPRTSWTVRTDTF